MLNRLHTDYAGSHDIDALAREAGMSVSTFHAHFKRVTASSPLQYLKTIRLHKARMLMVHDGLGAAAAAIKVGYESARSSAASSSATLVALPPRWRRSRAPT